MMKRREFLKHSITVIAGLALPMAALRIVDPTRLFAGREEIRWVFLVDTHKCVGCGFCVKACKIENEVPCDANVTRTWVERYVVTKDGRTFADTPKGARDGFTDKDRPGRGEVRGDKGRRDRKGLFCAQTLQPVREPALRPGLPGGGHLPDPGRGGAGGPDLVHRLRLLHHGLPLWCAFLPSGLPCGGKVQLLLPPDSQGDEDRPASTACPFGARQIGNIGTPKIR